jgi:hypothetical protein
MVEKKIKATPHVGLEESESVEEVWLTKVGFRGYSGYTGR